MTVVMSVRGPPRQVTTTQSAMNVANPDALLRDAYCVLGLAIDLIEMPEVIQRIDAAAAATTPFLISTVNINFLLISQSDPKFKESILLSDLCVADGMPVVWIARLMGIPIRHRVAGSDLFELLKAEQFSARPLRLFLFGGADGVAATVAKSLNSRSGRLRCVGWIYPGYGTIDEMSTDDVIGQINASGADFLIVSLGAQKGQQWLLRNHHLLRIPIRSHLGAVMNFEAGMVKRAPHAMRRSGLEWLWRIKEEPYLWRRYWRDGWALISLLLTRVLPLVVVAQWLRLSRRNQDFAIAQIADDDSVTLAPTGYATEPHVPEATSAFRVAVSAKKNVIIDLTDTRYIDCRFFGLLLMLRKQLEGSGNSLRVRSTPPWLARLFRLNGVGFLLE
jgi:N-acetylglucosaminyldiphosphoundecaprenol N-acetyl-beta-D-mannosaminyltransferase